MPFYSHCWGGISLQEFQPSQNTLSEGILCMWFRCACTRNLEAVSWILFLHETAHRALFKCNGKLSHSKLFLKNKKKRDLLIWSFTCKMCNLFVNQLSWSSTIWSFQVETKNCKLSSETLRKIFIKKSSVVSKIQRDKTKFKKVKYTT